VKQGRPARTNAWRVGFFSPALSSRAGRSGGAVLRRDICIKKIMVD